MTHRSCRLARMTKAWQVLLTWTASGWIGLHSRESWTSPPVSQSENGNPFGGMPLPRSSSMILDSRGMFHVQELCGVGVTFLAGMWGQLIPWSTRMHQEHRSIVGCDSSASWDLMGLCRLPGLEIIQTTHTHRLLLILVLKRLAAVCIKPNQSQGCTQNAGAKVEM